MRLNGWQRIGIVASVIWAVGGYLQMMGERNWASRMFDLCLSIPSPGGADNWSKCRQEYERDFPQAFKDKQTEAVLVALVPIPIGWLVVYMVIWVVRWIRRGFKPAT